MRPLITFCLLAYSFYSFGLETKILVRAKAKDAKFIGSSIGGAHVKIIDELTGELLASGITSGSTGNTTLIMKTPLERGKPVTDKNTAGFLATLDIDEPVYVKVEVTAPVNQRQSLIQSSTQLWVIPGKDLVGEGIIVEIPGFVIDVLAPRAHERIALTSLENGKLLIHSNIVMTCGCPITSGGTWDADQMEVVALVKINGEDLKQIKMRVTETSLFEGSFTPTEVGNYEVTVYAINSTTNNTGVDKVNFILN
jgi:hypothetical protein